MAEKRVYGWYPPENAVRLQENISAERASLIVSIADMGDDDLFRCFTSLKVSQSYVNDMLSSVRAEALRREVLGSPVFVRAV